MSFTLTKKNGSDQMVVEKDLLLLDGYVKYLMEAGYDVPEEFASSVPVDDDSPDSTSQATIGPSRPAKVDRSVDLTPAGQPIYTTASSARNAIDVIYAEKMEELRREQPSLFPKDTGASAERAPGPAEQARDRKWVPPHRREQFAENSWSANRVRKGLAVVSKRLNLSAVIRDRRVQEVYGYDDSQLNQVQILMQVSPEKAAIKATECARDNGHKVVVVADMTVASRSVARASLQRAAKALDPLIRSREVPMIYLPGSALVSLVPREGDLGGESEDAPYTWELTGPSREFTSLADVWMLISKYGPFDVAERYGSDYGFLRIMITVIDKSDRKATTLTPEYMQHSGSRRDGFNYLSQEFANLSAELGSLDFGCVPVSDNVSGVVASGVVPDSEWALVPYHVLKTPGGKLAGEVMEKADVRRLTTGLYAVKLRRPQQIAASRDFRVPKVDEFVRLRVVDFNADRATTVTVSPAGRVRYSDSGIWVDGISGYPGCSGSVYVSDVDGAIVGLHDGSGTGCSKIVPVCNDLVSLLHTAVAWYSGGGPTTTRVLSSTVRAWLRSAETRTRWKTLTARVDFEHEGMTVMDGAIKWIAKDQDWVDASESWLPSCSRDSTMSRVYRGYQVLDAPVDGLESRGGVTGEVVVLVFRDAEGIVVSSETTLGEECQFGRSNRVWMSSLRNGTLVVAAKDGRVVGVVTRLAHTQEWVTYRFPAGVDMETTRSTSSGVSGTVFGPSEKGNRIWLKERFPFLSVDSYGSEDIDECFTHSSCGKYVSATTVFSGYQNMARIGDAVMKTRYHVLLRRHGIDPQLTTVLVGKWQSNSVQSVVADQIGLPSQLRRASRLTTIGTHGLADALEALVCLVYFHEDATVLDKFLRVIAMFGEN